MYELTSGKSFLVDHGGPERSWSTTQHHGPAGAPGPPLDHLDPAWTTSCNHTPEIAVQGGSRWTRGTTGTMQLGGGPGVLWSHFYILLMCDSLIAHKYSISNLHSPAWGYYLFLP